MLVGLDKNSGGGGRFGANWERTPVMKCALVRVVVIAAVALGPMSLHADCGLATFIGTIECACGHVSMGLVCGGRGSHCGKVSNPCGDGSCYAVVASSSCTSARTVKRGRGFDVAKLENRGGDVAKVSPDQNSKKPAPSACGIGQGELNDWLSHPRSEGSR